LLDLTSLDFGSQPPSRVTDLTPLRALKKLVELDLDRNPVASLAPLGELPNLEQLFMIKMPVTLDLTPLAGAPRLVSLALQGDTIDNLGPLGAVSTLRVLSIDGATVLHPEGVAALTSLEELTATGVFDDAAPLAPLTKLKKLRIAQKPLRHFDSLATLVELRLLDVSNTGASDISAVAGMRELAFFFASSNQIRDIAPLSTLEQLQLVALNVNQISDLTPLGQNVGVGESDSLFLRDNALSCTDQKANLDAMRTRGATLDTDCE
jgi:internalin A